MLKIALICQNGASTGLVVRKMREAALKNQLEIEISAFPDSQLPNIIEDKDLILMGPQLAFKKVSFKNLYPVYAFKIEVVNTMDFGMMNGEKILKDALALIEKNK
ncbi:MAG: PTS sugar transporter subunit IIB [Erysipelotrichaceae bacterium]|nr:PTS sugar transporter subunit IIB [Erysipelotrichaceae bacterium]